jgi:Ca2+-dependent lipid-binding protein
VQVKFNKGKQDLHETKHILQDLDPVFTPETDSFFVLDTTAKELEDYKGLMFKVKDWDRIGKNDDLGHCYLEPNAINKATGEDMEFKITAPKGHSEAGYITIRIRPATEGDRVQKRSFLSSFKKAMAPTKDYGPTDLSILVEVVSCWKLPIADLASTDPYVKLKIGQRNVHETKPISKTREPIFTIRQNNLFILDIATKELTESGGITAKVKDYDFVGRNDALGSVTVTAEDVLNAKGERLEYSLMAANGQDAGFIALRFRPAKNYDRQFLQAVSADSDKKKEVDFLGIERSYEKTMQPFTGPGIIKTMLKKNTKEGNSRSYCYFRGHIS